MEDVLKTVSEYGKTLRRLMSLEIPDDSSSVYIRRLFPFRRVFIVILWVLAAISFVIGLIALFTMQDAYSLTVLEFFTPMVVLCLLGIRYLSFCFVVKVDERRFEFTGLLRKNKSFSLDDYIGAETLLTIKDFPEEYVVRFKKGNGEKRFKLADLNKGSSRSIEPNNEAVCALWNSIVQAMEQHPDNTLADPAMTDPIAD